MIATAPGSVNVLSSCPSSAIARVYVLRPPCYPSSHAGFATSPGTIAAAIIAISFAAGLNLYGTILSLGVLARLHWVTLPSGLESLQNSWIIAVSAILFSGEFFADKIPGFDLVWNALHTFIRIPVAAVLAYAAGSHLSPEMQLLVTCLGAVIAAIAHTSKTAARILVTPSPEPLTNIALSTGEDGLAIGLSWFALHHAIAAASVVAALCLVCVVTVWLSLRAIRSALTRFRGNRPLAPLRLSSRPSLP